MCIDYAMTPMGERIFSIIAIGGGIVFPIGLALFVLWFT